MPTIIDKVKIHTNKEHEKLDRRIKLTTSEKIAIRERYFNMHESERPSQRELAEQYGVTRRLIQFILYPERDKRQKELAKERRKDGRYYDKEKRRCYMQNHRAYKRKLVEAGKLALPIDVKQ